MDNLSRINKLIRLNKIRRVGLMASAVMLALNAYMFNSSGSIYSDIGVFFSMAGMIYFIVDFKGL